MPWLAVVAGGLGLYGQHQNRRAQRNAENANAAYLEEQKRLTQAANRREANIYLTESDRLIGTQKSMLGRAGIAFSGGAIMALVESKVTQAIEYSAILEHGKSAERLADIRARQAREMASFYGSKTLAATQTLGTLLNAYGAYEERQALLNNQGADV